MDIRESIIIGSFIYAKVFMQKEPSPVHTYEESPLLIFYF